MFWSRLKAFFHPTNRSAPLEQRRQRLRQEQRMAARQLRDAFLAYEQRLFQFERHLREIKHTADATQELTFLEEAQQGLQRLLKRLTLADQETETVLHEWQDWQTMRDLRALTVQERDRLTLLRSELVARGLAVEASKPVRMREVATVKQSNKKQQTYQPTALSEDPFSEWDEVMRPAIVREVAFLDAACARLPAGSLHETAVFLFARRKEAHARKKQIERI